MSEPTHPALHAFAVKRRDAAAALSSLADALTASGLPLGDAPTRLAALAERARSGRFTVVLVGCFSTGKSTLLNALLGAPVLPVKVNPCTAIPTEVTFGDAPGVTVRRHDGTLESLDVAAFLEQYQLGATGDDSADRFGSIERASLRWPLPLLGDGVTLLDTPGLDDDDQRTARTLSVLPEADAVIFVLNASRFLAELERRTLRRELVPRGLTNLFFPVTMADLLPALSDDPEGDLLEMRRRAREVLGPLAVVDGVDRTDDRVFFLDARGALASRWDRSAGAARAPVDAEALQRSGMTAFEASLERFLVDERGRVQLRVLRDAVLRLRRETTRQGEMDRATADASVEELRGRVEELAPRFKQLHAIARRVARTVEGFVARQQALVWRDLRDFMAQTEADLPEAIGSFDLGPAARLDLITPKGREKIERALREQLEAWLAERVAGWHGALRPRLEASLDALRVELAGEGRDFDDLVARITLDFAGGVASLPSAEAKDAPVDPVERWFSVAVGAALLSPGAMAAGFVDGYEGALKGAAGRIGVRLALLALGTVLGPVGWAGILLYAVSDAVLLVLTGGSQLRRARAQMAEALRGQLVARAEASREEVEARVAAALAPLAAGLVGAADAEAAALQDQVERTVVARERAARDAARRAEAWSQVDRALDEAITRLEASR